MKIRYTFDNGETSEVEVSEEIGTFIMDSRRNEESANRKEHRHSWSLDSIEYEGVEYGVADIMEDLLNEQRNNRIDQAFSHLSEAQKRRLLMLANGLSVHEIARREGKAFYTIYESIESAKKKFLKNF